MGFSCAKCSNFIYYSEGKVCAGLYETGGCFCRKCQDLISKALKGRKCGCEYSLVGYSARHSIHGYALVIQGLVKVFFKGSKLWVKLVCRSCERVIRSFKLDCECYLEQRRHLHRYSSRECLNCASGVYVRSLSEGDLKQKYGEYHQKWQEKAEFTAQKALKQQYKYDGEGYWTECSFCGKEVRGKVKDKGGLARNKVGFWTEDLEDERVICGDCLRDKKVVKELGVRGARRQMLWNYRRRKLV